MEFGAVIPCLKRRLHDAIVSSLDSRGGAAENG